MGHPCRFRIGVCLSCLDVVFAHVPEEVTNPPDVLLYRHRHVTQDRGAARSGYHKHVGESSYLQAKVSFRALGPLVFKRHIISTADIHLKEGARHSVKTGSEDDYVELELFVLSPYPLRRDLLDWRVANIDQLDVLAVVGIEVIGVYKSTLRSKGMVSRQKLFDGLGILHRFSNLGPDELGNCVVCPSVRREVFERPE